MSKKLRFGYITAKRKHFAVNALCRVLKVSEAGYYHHLRTPRRSERDAILLAQIHALIKEEEYNSNYGVNRIFDYLRINKEYKGGKYTIKRICKENNLMIRPKWRTKGITKADEKAQKAENLIKQNFRADEPGTKCLTDITEVPCLDGKLYCTAVLDCFDGMITGFSIADNMRKELCIDAFKDACRYAHKNGMIMHSDRGSQFTSHAFRMELAKINAIQSMSSTGRCYDNSRMESWFATLKKESLYKIKTSELKMDEVKSIIFRFIHYYNLRRIYSTNDGYPPAVLRRMFYEKKQVA